MFGIDDEILNWLPKGKEIWPTALTIAWLRTSDIGDRLIDIILQRFLEFAESVTGNPGDTEKLVKIASDFLWENSGSGRRTKAIIANIR
jgi:hypothetical protein